MITRLVNGAEIEFLEITDKDTVVQFQCYDSTGKAMPNCWFTTNKEKLFGALGSLWPDDIAILNTDEPENE